MTTTSMVSIKKTLIDITGRFILPKSEEQDKARREFILNILLAAIITFLFVSIILHAAVWEVPYIIGSGVYSNDIISLFTLLLIFFFFLILFFLSRRGFFFIASYIFIFSLLLLAVYSSYTWGVDANASLLFYVLIIVMSGILVGTRFSFLILSLSSLSILVLGYYQINHIISPKLYWKGQSLNGASIVMYATILFIIATVSWLSNREIEKSLARARKSEAELKKERDSLEIKVEERTRELREMQAEEMVQLYRFAEFGRLSSGLFHDLINPLNAVVLNIEMIRSQGADVGIIDETETCLDSAIHATKKMENMVVAVRKQISKQKNKAVFSLAEEIRQVIDMLAHKARQAGVEIVFLCPDDIQVFGEAIKFNQVVLNLVNNAIDAYLSATFSKGAGSLCKITVSLSEENDRISLSVQDYGMGIPKENFNKIFEPFFTTKDSGGMGIGLSMVKRIVEKDFGGEISMKSEQGQGTVFTISFQKNLHEKQ